jgi:hypothetical protein
MKLRFRKVANDGCSDLKSSKFQVPSSKNSETPILGYTPWNRLEWAGKHFQSIACDGGIWVSAMGPTGRVRSELENAWLPFSFFLSALLCCDFYSICVNGKGKALLSAAQKDTRI